MRQRSPMRPRLRRIYNQGIADRIATLKTEPRTAAQIEEWLTGRNLVMVAQTVEAGPVAFAASFPYSSRPATAASENSRFM